MSPFLPRRNSASRLRSAWSIGVLPQRPLSELLFHDLEEVLENFQRHVVPVHADGYVPTFIAPEGEQERVRAGRVQGVHLDVRPAALHLGPGHVRTDPYFVPM